MIKITIFRDVQGRVNGYEVKGHANYADAGEDIVCAAISALSLTGMMAGEKIACISPEHHPQNGHLVFFDPGNLEHNRQKDLRIILETIAIGMYQTAKNYPGTVSITDEGGEYSWH